MQVLLYCVCCISQQVTVIVNSSTKYSNMNKAPFFSGAIVGNKVVQPGVCHRKVNTGLRACRYVTARSSHGTRQRGIYYLSTKPVGVV